MAHSSLVQWFQRRKFDRQTARAVQALERAVENTSNRRQRPPLYRRTGFKPRRLWRSYLLALHPGLAMMIRSIASVEGAAALIAFVVLLFNRELGTKLLGWEGIDPRWAIVPILFHFLHTIVRMVHERFEDLRRENHELREKLGNQQIRSALTELVRSGKRLKELIDSLPEGEITPENISNIHNGVANWAALAAVRLSDYDTLREHFSQQELTFLSLNSSSQLQRIVAFIDDRLERLEYVLRELERE